MTVLVGVRCSNGIVIGTDSAITYAPVPDPQHFTAEVSQGLKIYVVGNTVIATTGEVGLAQRFVTLMQALTTGGMRVNNTLLRDFPVVDAGAAISQLAIQQFRATGHPWERQVGLGALIGMVQEAEPRLYCFDPISFRPELIGERDEHGAFRTLPLATLGSGSKLADPYLLHAHRVLFGETHFPTTADGRLLVACTLDHVIRYNTGGVGGSPHVASLEFDGAAWVVRHAPDDEVRQQVEDLEKYIRAYRNGPPPSAVAAATPDLNAALDPPAPNPADAAA